MNNKEYRNCYRYYIVTLTTDANACFCLSMEKEKCVWKWISFGFKCCKKYFGFIPHFMAYVL